MEDSIMQNIIKKLLILFITLIGVSNLQAQSIKIDYTKIAKEYPTENIIQLKKSIYYDISIDKSNEIDITKTTIERYIYLKNVNNAPLTLSFYSSAFSHLIDFKAYSYVLDGEKYRRIEVKEYNEKINVGGYAFYDDIKEMVVTFPGIADGTIIELTTKHKILEPRLLNRVFINNYMPIHEFDFKMEVDKNIDVEIIKYNWPEDLIISTNESRKKKIYSYSADRLGRVEYEDFQPDISYFLPHLIPKIKSYNVGNKKVEILTDLNSLYKWYWTFIEKNTKEEISSEIKKKVDKITEHCSSEYEKLQSIFYWVQENIKYIAFEDAMGGFIPRGAIKTFNNKYGDCKDKTALLYAMLKAAGIESYFTWIGSNEIPYKYEEVPTPLADNHMILTYKNNAKYYFLDGTSEYLNIEFPSEFTQGKEALISINQNTFEVKTVPIIKPKDNKIIDTIYVNIDRDDIIGNGSCEFSGYCKSDLYAGLFLKNTQEKRNYIESLIEKGNDKFVLTKYELDDLENFNAKCNLNYEFELKRFLKSTDNNKFINLNFDKDWLSYEIKDDRRNPITFDHKVFTKLNVILKIPKGYYLEFLARNSTYHDNDYGFDIEYITSGDEVQYNHSLYINTLYISPSEFDRWNKFIKKLENEYKQTIIIKKYEN
jgi:hypothetical protein